MAKQRKLIFFFPANKKYIYKIFEILEKKKCFLSIFEIFWDFFLRIGLDWRTLVKLRIPNIEKHKDFFVRPKYFSKCRVFDKSIFFLIFRFFFLHFFIFLKFLMFFWFIWIFGLFEIFFWILEIFGFFWIYFLDFFRFFLFFSLFFGFLRFLDFS